MPLVTLHCKYTIISKEKLLYKSCGGALVKEEAVVHNVHLGERNSPIIVRKYLYFDPQQTSLRRGLFKYGDTFSNSQVVMYHLNSKSVTYIL